MSTTEKKLTGNCGYSRCNDEYEYHEAVEGAFCSKECYYTHRGEKLLKNIKYDHKFCFSCFRQLKEVEKPTAEQKRKISGLHSTKAVIGYQYLTRHATKGLKVKRERPRVDQRATVCECGSHHDDDYLRGDEIVDLVDRLIEIFKLYRAENPSFNKTFNVRKLVESLLADRPWGYALGRAVEDAEK